MDTSNPRIGRHYSFPLSLHTHLGRLADLLNKGRSALTEELIVEALEARGASVPKGYAAPATTQSIQFKLNDEEENK